MAEHIADTIGELNEQTPGSYPRPAHSYLSAHALQTSQEGVAAQHCLSGHMLHGRIQVQKHFRFL